jgi:hypothetical protein
VRAVRLVVAAALTAAFLAPAAHAGVILGVHGNAPRFASQTGQQSQIGLTFVSFAQGNVLARVAAAIGPVPMIALNTGSYGAAQTATSRGIALGQNDRFLFQLNGVVARWPGTRFYVRPFPEMNAHWSGTSAYNRDGTRRDAAHSTQWTRKAFARITVVLRGGTRDVVSVSLAKLGLPGIAADLRVTTPKLRMVWNPQGFGAPDVAGNSAQAYYPGDAYVDVVGDDLYDMPGHGATWSAAQKLLRRPSVEALRVPRVRARGLRRSAVHPRHGEVGEAAPARGVRLIFLRPHRLDLGSRDEARVALGVSRPDHPARDAALTDQRRTSRSSSNIAPSACSSRRKRKRYSVKTAKKTTACSTAIVTPASC